MHFLCCGPKYAVKLNVFNVFAAIMFKLHANRNKQANAPSNMDLIFWSHAEKEWKSFLGVIKMLYRLYLCNQPWLLFSLAEPHRELLYFIFHIVWPRAPIMVDDWLHVLLGSGGGIGEKGFFLKVFTNLFTSRSPPKTSWAAAQRILSNSQ